MPHLVIERLRNTPHPFDCCGERPGRKGRSLQCVYIVEVLEIIAGVTFIWGSLDFLPQYSKDPHILLHACALFTAGGIIYFGVSCFCLYESIEMRGFMSLESCENAFYVIGAFVFFLGTLLYWPFDFRDEEAAILASADAVDRGFGLPTYVNTVDTHFQGSVLFIAGSLMFSLAAFANGLNRRRFNDVTSQMLTATTSLYMLGSLLFVMGSVAFLPHLGCNQKMETFGGVCYIIGSVQYELGGWVSFFRTMLEESYELDGIDEENIYGATSILSAAKGKDVL